MKPTKKVVFIPNENCSIKDEQIVFPNGTHVLGKTGYFFTPEQLNEYTANVIKQALETAAEEAEVDFESYDKEFVNKESITNTFEEIFQNHKIMNTENVSNEEKGNGVLADVIRSLSIEDLRKAFEMGQEQKRAENWSYNAGYDKEHPRYDKNADVTFDDWVKKNYA